ncbi:GntR family transcriptional regulator [Arsenicicoccus sp. oral taxon 190]|uniref:GntR family transcriptional regulator n=1 Tax=Arsenicicoccus sp. oral taxon 190 TaxID=1658671 RepID=UPI00067A4338|nr:GntR family transcriptional regulator [Arsenicicoccus sp. oral taxon 190]AKT50885.1 GntR family transcriptional regulator [Arsenicicoccus sp. oral taxon 190]
MPTALPVSLDRASSVPLYDQLAAQLRAAIDDGVLRPGDPFENELSLAARLHVSRPTVRKAIAQLAADGLLVRHRGIGTRVASPVVHQRDDLTPLYAELDRTGRRPTTHVARLTPARRNTVAATALGLDPRTPLVYLERVRWSDGRPLVVLRSWLPPQLATLTASELTERGLYALLAERGVVPDRARQRLGARLATLTERRQLQLTRADAVLTVLWQSYAADGSAIEYGDHAYRGDQYVVDNTLTW